MVLINISHLCSKCSLPKDKGRTLIHRISNEDGLRVLTREGSLLLLRLQVGLNDDVFMDVDMWQKIVCIFWNQFKTIN